METRLFQEDKITEFQRKLLQWYKNHQRKMPWRGSSSPYEIWVSEIMLQQTRVDTVIPYYKRFIDRLPNLKALAEVEDHQLLKLWEGLGYYSRVRNMKETAKFLMEKHAGAFPKRAKELMELKGIGEYTAGAIASICFGERVAAVDGNVLRVMARLTGSTMDIKDAKVKREIIHQVKSLLPAVDIGNFNQALIEVGAIICKPNSKPDCFNCPIIAECIAYEKGLQNEIPIKSPRAEKKQQEITVLLMEHKGRFAIKKRTHSKLLKDLWEFPNIEGKKSSVELTKLLKEWGLKVIECQPLKNSKAIFTHIQWILSGYYLAVEEVQDMERDLMWVTKEELLREYSMASAFKEFRRQLIDGFDPTTNESI
ncbi:A/G-specific adenine glycosylase [Alkaliphilus serpentinus]|uniref:Adenine DNA glycosylase n=1 Tax=Alkaliphilus serpentinus TaxID=1482731 RepID=A0A833HLM2_9FIRM|nr:A/G-specific adenine glycosylase [Alkaliphilus serpentinus]KAB3526242.1 A/G-specific adenine glycosylase [Alkaliphilus serpentinus]